MFSSDVDSPVLRSVLAVLCPKDILQSPNFAMLGKSISLPHILFQSSMVVPLAATKTKSLIFYYAGDLNSQILLLSHLGTFLTNYLKEEYYEGNGITCDALKNRFEVAAQLVEM